MAKFQCLKDYVEKISDDFSSTFTVIDENCLGNMLQGPQEFEEVARIIRKYLGDVQVKFTKSGMMDDEYDFYHIAIEK